jgi:hypothetical protein
MSDNHDNLSTNQSSTDDPSPDERVDDEFTAEVERARGLLDDDVEALHVGVVRDGEVDTTFAQRAGDDTQTEGLRALALLAAHVQLVATEAGVEAPTVAADAATLAGRVDQVPAAADDLPDE